VVGSRYNKLTDLTYRQLIANSKLLPTTCTSLTITLCSKKVTPKFKSLQLRYILSELNILLAALITIFPT